MAWIMQNAIGYWIVFVAGIAIGLIMGVVAGLVISRLINRPGNEFLNTRTSIEGVGNRNTEVFRKEEKKTSRTLKPISIAAEKAEDLLEPVKRWTAILFNIALYLFLWGSLVFGLFRGVEWGFENFPSR